MKTCRLVVLTCAILGLFAVANAFTLVKDGQPAATIVVAAGALAAPDFVPSFMKVRAQPTAEQKIKMAAADLQGYIGKMSGARLPIVSDAEAVQGAVILVGPSAKTKAPNLQIPDGLTMERLEEGYLISCKGDTLVLAGNIRGQYRGTEYAVAEFLYQLGVRWYMPGEFGEYVPKAQTITFKDITFRDKPDFLQRNWSKHMTEEMFVEEYRWKIHNKINPAEVLPTAVDSSLNAFLPDEALAKEHPEYFGKRPDGSVNPFMPNLSHPDTPKMVAEKMKAVWKKAEWKQLPAEDPNLSGLGIAPDDGLPMDTGAETMKTNQGFTDVVGREGTLSDLSVSEEWFTFLNKVAAEVVKEYPDIIISTNGYANRNRPPEGVALHPNLAVMFAALWSDTLHAFDSPLSWQANVQGQMLKRWCDLNKRVFIYGYNYDMLVSALTPVPTTRKLARNLPLMKKWGVAGFSDEARNSFMEAGITTHYLRARLYWDADLDVEATLNEYFAHWYGAAAKPAKAFWDALEETIENTPYLGHEDRILPYVYSDELIARLEKSVTEAERLAQDDRGKLHVEIDRHILEHLKAYMAMSRAEWDGKYAEAARQADVMFRHRDALYKMSPFLYFPEGEGGYASGVWYWNLTARKDYYLELADMLNGKTGDLLAMAPRQVKFSLDPADIGQYERWYAADYDRRPWRTLDCTQSYYMQGYLSERGVPYRGAMWYIFEVDVPRSAAGKPVRLYSPVVTTDAWVWVNGQYIGRRGYIDQYIRPAALDFDLTKAVKTGKNIIGVRVSTSMNLSQAADGFLGRLFLYSPKPAPAGK
jgi:hypothetical protein